MEMPDSKEVIKALAKADQAKSELGKRAIDALDKNFNTTLKETDGVGANLVGMAKDWTALLRLKSILVIMDLVEKIRKKEGKSGLLKKIPEKYLLPFITEASKESDPEIQELWAQLIANATDPNKEINIQKVHMSILSQLEPLDAKLLEWFGTQKNPSLLIKMETIISSFGVPGEGLEIPLENLMRLGCLDGSQINTIDDIGSNIRKVGNPNTIFFLTSVGESLIEACRK